MRYAIRGIAILFLCAILFDVAVLYLSAAGPDAWSAGSLIRQRRHAFAS
ncbi:MAG TPA: hypothetical protein VH854_09185 [Thermoanaerobaculia bacterium]|jgi:hypothetical protein|nr:hypothetical protein [Thermoanaerobaculia bacterium]